MKKHSEKIPEEVHYLLIKILSNKRRTYEKILIIILTLLLCTGCFDYKEINDLAIINAIGVDYEDDEYVITLEILNDQIDKDSSKITSYTKVGHGKI